MNKPPKEVELFFAIGAVIVSIAMFAASVCCNYQSDDSPIFIVLVSVDWLAIPISCGLAQATVVQRSMETELTKTIWKMCITYIFGMLVHILFLLSLITQCFGRDYPSEVHLIMIIVAFLIPLLIFLANLLSWIAIFFLKQKKEWTLYTIAQTLFIIDAAVIYINH